MPGSPMELELAELVLEALAKHPEDRPGVRELGHRFLAILG